MLEQFMIRLERLVFAGQYELRYFDYDSSGDFELPTFLFRTEFSPQDTA